MAAVRDHFVLPAEAAWQQNWQRWNLGILLCISCKSNWVITIPTNTHTHTKKRQSCTNTGYLVKSVQAVLQDIVSPCCHTNEIRSLSSIKVIQVASALQEEADKLLFTLLRHSRSTEAPRDRVV